MATALNSRAAATGSAKPLRQFKSTRPQELRRQMLEAHLREAAIWALQKQLPRATGSRARGSSNRVGKAGHNDSHQAGHVVVKNRSRIKTCRSPWKTTDFRIENAHRSQRKGAGIPSWPWALNVHIGTASKIDAAKDNRRPRGSLPQRTQSAPGQLKPNTVAYRLSLLGGIRKRSN